MKRHKTVNVTKHDMSPTKTKYVTEGQTKRNRGG